MKELGFGAGLSMMGKPRKKRAKRKKSTPRKKKPIMEIGMSSKYITANNKYNVYWGTTKNAYNNQHKSFEKRKDAMKFKNELIKKYEDRYKIDYMYLAD